VIYVCGDARHMARDVEAALRAACSAAGGLGPDAAAEYLDELRAAGRYRQDVY
jgi:sulfite reductase (NADPH) flavoprotein alpha-component